MISLSEPLTRKNIGVYGIQSTDQLHEKRDSIKIYPDQYTPLWFVYSTVLFIFFGVWVGARTTKKLVDLSKSFHLITMPFFFRYRHYNAVLFTFS